MERRGAKPLGRGHDRFSMEPVPRPKPYARPKPGKGGLEWFSLEPIPSPRKAEYQFTGMLKFAGTKSDFEKLMSVLSAMPKGSRFGLASSSEPVRSWLNEKMPVIWPPGDPADPLAQLKTITIL